MQLFYFRGSFGDYADIDTLYHIEPLMKPANEVRVKMQYLIMQIVRGGKLSWSQYLVEICRKTFAVLSFVQYLLTSLMKNLLENFHSS